MLNLSTQQQSAICLSAQCQSIIDIRPMQSLWAGQGELARLTLSSSSGTRSLVVKQISYSPDANHPRGWNTQLSQRRKRRSYEIELHWYREFASWVKPFAPVPELVYSQSSEQGMLLVLEDLAVHYPVRFNAGKDDRPTLSQIQATISWLANFHGRTLNRTADGLWPLGGYWHLETRPDEWQAMPEGELKQKASTLDVMLRDCPYQALIHGDAKLANFCFDKSGKQVAAVDFQYVGKGPGVKDLMLLLSSVMPNERLVQEAPALVEYYFEKLAQALREFQPDVYADEVIAAWRPLYAVSWADFHRFLEGWCSGHWKIGSYCQQQTEVALLAVGNV